LVGLLLEEGSGRVAVGLVGVPAEVEPQCLVVRVESLVRRPHVHPHPSGIAAQLGAESGPVEQSGPQTPAGVAPAHHETADVDGRVVLQLLWPYGLVVLVMVWLGGQRRDRLTVVPENPGRALVNGSHDLAAPIFLVRPGLSPLVSAFGAQPAGRL